MKLPEGMVIPRRSWVGAAVPTGSQRSRLLIAMAECAAAHGYPEATVSRVVAGAGVSRATFYRQFRDREDCGLALFRWLEGCLRHRLGESAAEEGTDPMRAFLTVLLAAAEADPAAARFLAIESLGAGRQIAAERNRLWGALEKDLTGRLGERDVPLQITPRALLGGVEGLIALRAFRGEAHRLCHLLFDLLGWAESYAAPGAAAISERDWEAWGAALDPGPENVPSPEHGALPRGRSALGAKEAETRQREKIFAAVASCSRELGYACVTVADIVAAAEVGRQCFYRHFGSKAEAFHATQSFALREIMTRTAFGYYGIDAWADRVWHGLAAMLSHASRQPDLTCIDLVESFAAGPEAVGRSFENRLTFNIFLEDGYRLAAAPVPRISSEAIGGAILALLRGKVTASEPERAIAILPQAAYLSLAPFLGSSVALHFVEAKLKEATST